ncbi:HAD-IIIA family hydrolase [Prochlorococcus marinus XMU1411]|uniref:HAD-IIIA family hydrolase n=1 Tax=Prochlorococcus marinus TaxID=1219 RepID=UPI001ADD48DA|nr:HAD-IIIA family hydrolase [Prochlorococcus marinus]MBO8244234.1 HAD-IIIA family hydrolase [Prochlorococcus marinus XMU1411]MBW3055320.1 haloacid dehalogenase [Prochlorococcus marinus str. MU1411]MCR8537062.1 HAD-IIIA family hydrolase [Prochlorococcus marinus CUG1430]
MLIEGLNCKYFESKFHEFDSIRNIKRPCLFLDRDGVLIKECHYLKEPEKVEIEKGILKIMHLARNNGWYVVVISNQSGIARGVFSWEDYELVTKRIIRDIGSPFPINAILANGLGPESKKDSWRKPSPKMINYVAKKINIDIKKSIILGDRLSDLIAGINAGIVNVIHTETGHGKKEKDSVVKFFQNYKNRSSLYLINDMKSFPIDLLIKL